MSEDVITPAPKVDPETFAIRSKPARAIRFRRGVIIAIAALGSVSLMAVALARRVGKDLTEHESRFRAAFYQANVGMLKLDAGGRVVEANQAMADILDHRRDVLLQMSLAELLMEGELVIDESGHIDWERQLRALTDALAGTKPA